MPYIKTQNSAPFTLGIANICIHPDKFNVPVKNLVKISKGIHGSDIIEILTGNESIIGFDGAITKNREIDLGVSARDCIPIIFIDDEKVGVVHAGWRGLVRGIVEKMIPLFNQETIAIYVGPFLQRFEIKKDASYEEIKKRFGAQFFEEEEGNIMFNFLKAAQSILPESAIWDERNLAEDLSLPSNRRGDKHSFVTTVSFTTQ